MVYFKIHTVHNAHAYHIQFLRVQRFPTTVSNNKVRRLIWSQRETFFHTKKLTPSLYTYFFYFFKENGKRGASKTLLFLTYQPPTNMSAHSQQTACNSKGCKGINNVLSIVVLHSSSGRATMKWEGENTIYRWDSFSQAARHRACILFLHVLSLHVIRLSTKEHIIVAGVCWIGLLFF